MNFRTILLSTLAGLLPLAGCGKNGPLNADLIGDMVGGQTGHLVKAGGHVGNAMAISEKDEDALGQSAAVALTNRYGLYNDPKLLKYVTLVGLTVASASPNPNANYVFGILNTEDVNAFSGPNGYVLITHGLVRQMKDEAELAGVLAHEIAHVSNHDGLHQVQAAERSTAFAEGLKATSNDADRFGQLIDGGVDVLTKQAYTQPQEFDADQAGVRVMSAAGYDGQSYLNLLQRLHTTAGSSNNATLMSTHPGLDARIQRVDAQLKGLKAGGATLADRFAKNAAK